MQPTASLDADIAVKVRATLRYMQRERGVTIIYTSHNMHEIEHMCDEVLFLVRGQSRPGRAAEGYCPDAHGVS